jgi:hypothetical protein
LLLKAVTLFKPPNECLEQIFFCISIMSLLKENDYVLVDGSLFIDGKQHLYKIIGTPSAEEPIHLMTADYEKPESKRTQVYRSPAYYKMHGDPVKTPEEQTNAVGLLIPYDRAGSLLTKSNKNGMEIKEGGKRRNRRSTQGRRRKNRRHHSRRR